MIILSWERHDPFFIKSGSLCGGAMKRKKKKAKFVVRPWSLGACPTADEVRAAWARRRVSQKDFIGLLSLLGELTCFTDCNLRHLGGFGNIAGRRGGLKAWLGREAPELTAKYKSISRHAALALKIKKAFDFYPPAPLSLLHPDLPRPKCALPYIVRYAANLRELHFRDVAPTYVAFKALADRRLRAHKPRYRWGPALPQEKWKEAEEFWYRRFVVPKAKAQIRADSEFFSRTFDPNADCRYCGES